MSDRPQLLDKNGDLKSELHPFYASDHNTASISATGSASRDTLYSQAGSKEYWLVGLSHSGDASADVTLRLFDGIGTGSSGTNVGNYGLPKAAIVEGDNNDGIINLPGPIKVTNKLTALVDASATVDVTAYVMVDPGITE